MQLERVTAGDLDVGYLAIGEGPLAVCLHGFPDTAHTWRYLLPQLAEAGFRAVAPFQRGYAPTAVPADGLYQSGALAADANALHEALGGDSGAVVIGHDWGARAAYGAAGAAPDRWARVVAMAVPPGSAIATAFVSNLDQLQRSWYMFLFQHPLADLVVPANDYAFIERLWSQWSPGYDATADVARVRQSLADPANVLAALTYYRATLGDAARDSRLDREQTATNEIPPQPTLYLHGRDDGCIGVEVADAAAGLTADEEHVTIEVLDDCGHFLHLERPDAVGARILEFVT